MIGDNSAAASSARDWPDKTPPGRKEPEPYPGHPGVQRGFEGDANFAHRFLALVLGLLFCVLLSSNAQALTGGPDGYGYVFSDETADIAFDFEDISGTAADAVISGSDDATEEATIGFPFPFYGTDHDTVNISTNGLLNLNFTSTSSYSSSWKTDGSTTGVKLIAGWWEDLNPSAGGNIYYETLGTAPNRRFIVQFDTVEHYGGGNPVTFQFKLFESGRIEIHFQTMATDGGSHSVGIQDGIGNGLSYYYGAGTVPDGSAVAFFQPIGIDGLVTGDQTPLLTGTVDDPSAAVSVEVDGSTYTATNHGDGTWSADVTNSLVLGTYDVIASTGTYTDATTNELTIAAPVVTVDALTTMDITPTLTGTVNAHDAIVQVTVEGHTYPATNHQDGAWSVEITTAVSAGTHDVAAQAANPQGTASDGTVDELTRTPLTGGPDGYGYIYTGEITSGAITYDFENISGAGTHAAISGSDEATEAVAIGFAFPFYGTDHNTVNVSTNGLLNFTSTDSFFESWELPVTDVFGPISEQLIAGWWGDLEPGAGGDIYYATLGAAPNRRFIVQFDTVEHYGGGNPVTFQFKLFESGRIEIHFQTMATDGDNYSVGIQDGTGNGLSYYYGTGAVPDGSAVAFFRTVTIDLLATGDQTPLLTGTVDDPFAAVSVEVDGSTYTATNHGDGTWSAQVTTPLPLDTYDVVATAVGTETSTDITVDELTIAAPDVTVDALTTMDTTPTLTGTVNTHDADLEITVDGNSYLGTNHQDGTWSVEITTPLTTGAYDVVAEATNPLGGDYDDTFGELVVESRCFHDDFESGPTLGADWSPSTLANGRVTVGTYDPYQGNYALQLDAESGLEWNSLASAMLAVDDPLTLEFLWKGMGTTPDEHDGVFFSGDGGANWVQAMSFDGSDDSYSSVTLDLDTIASDNGVTIGPGFQIKFQFGGMRPLGDDGYLIDNVSVSCATNNSPPSAAAGGAYAVAEGGTLNLDASGATDPDGNALVYQWDLDNDGQYDDASGVSPSIDWATLQALGYDGDESRTIGLRVFDGLEYATAAATVTVDNTPPTLGLSGAATVTYGDSYTLNLSALTDPGPDTATACAIDWDDGSTSADCFSLLAAGGSANHDFASAGPKTITVTVTDEDGNYTYTHDVTVDKAALIATADDKSRPFGGVNPAFTFSYSGFVYGENTSVIDTLPTGAITATTTSDAGTYAITCDTNGSDDNYAITCGNGTLTITQADTSVSIDSVSPSPSVAGQSVTIAYSVSGPTPITGAVNVSDGGSHGCSGTVAAGQCDITFTAAGNYTLNASYGGDTNHAGSSSAGESHTVNPSADLSITKDNGQSESLPGETVTYTLVAANAGPSPLTGATVTDTLPAVLSNASWSCVGAGGASCTASGSGDLNDSIDLPVGGSATYTLSATLAIDARGTLENSASISHGAHDPDATNNSASASDTIRDLDWGDAPDDNITGIYPTLAVNDGARHGISGLLLGAQRDGELDGQPTAAADGDDLTGDPNDEDGIAFTAPLTRGGAGSVEVTATGAGLLNAWIDFNADGDWQDAGEQVFIDQAVNAGVNSLDIAVPADAVVGDTYARFRLDSTGGLTPSGGALDGEVEDYRVTLNKTPSEIAITSDTPDPSVVGEAVTIRYSVAGGSPTGTVTVSDGGSHSCSASVADGECDITFNQAATYELTASYAGDGNHTASASVTESHQVNPAATSLTITSDTPDPSQPGEAVTVGFDLTVASPGAGTPSGSVTIGDGEDSCTATLPNTSCTLSLTTLGNHTLTASYGGDADFLGSSDTEPHEVSQIATVTEITGDTPDPSVVGETVTISYTVTGGSPTGQVTVSDNGSHGCSGTVAAGQCDITFTAAGNYTLNASYGGDTNHAGSSSAGESHTVNPSADLSITKDNGQSESLPGETVTYTLVAANAGPSPLTGATVTDTLPAVLSNASWSCVGAGGASCTASGSGDLNDSIDLPVGGSATYTLSATLAIDARGTLENSASISHGAHDPDATNNSASASDTIRDLDWGDAPDDNITGIYPTLAVNDGARHGISGLLLGAQRDGELDGQPTAAADGDDLTGDPNDEDGIAFTAPLTRGGAGSVEVTATGAGLLNAWIDFNADGDWQDAGEQVFIDQAVNAGVNSLDIAVPADAVVGDTYARFRLDSTGGLTPSGGALDGEVEDYRVTLNKTPSEIAITSDTPDPSVVGEAVTIRYSVAGGSPTGTVTVSDGGSHSCSASVADGECDITFNQAATYELTASYAGDGNHTASASVTESHQVNPAATSLTISRADPSGPSLYGQPIRFDFELSIVVPGAGTPTGTVTLSDGVDSCVAILPETGCAIGFSSDGSKTITATYAGDDNFLESISPGFDYTLRPYADLSITKDNGQSQSVIGQKMTYTIVVANAGPSAVAGVQVTDAPPAALTAVSWSCQASPGASCGSMGGGDLNDRVTLPAGSSVTYLVNATLDMEHREPTLTNTAKVGVPGGVTDPDLSNNSAADTDAVIVETNSCHGDDVLVTKTRYEREELAGIIICVGNNSITAHTEVRATPGSNVTYSAPTITLGEGFRVEAGATFQAGDYEIPAIQIAPRQTKGRRSRAVNTFDTGKAGSDPLATYLATDDLLAEQLHALSRYGVDFDRLGILTEDGVGHYLVFTTDQALVAEDENDVSDVYAIDMRTDQLWLISRTASGEAGNGASGYPAIDGAGEHILFHSQASDLMPADKDPGRDLFLYQPADDLLTPLTAELEGEAAHPAVDATGTRILFDHTPADGEPRLMQIDWPQPAPFEILPPGPARYPAISPDSTVAAFVENPGTQCQFVAVERATGIEVLRAPCPVDWMAPAEPPLRFEGAELLWFDAEGVSTPLGRWTH